MSFPPPHAAQPDGYHAYMMRLWQAGIDGTWRVALHCVHTGEKIHFASLESLYAYLQTRVTGQETGAAVDEDTGNVTS